MKSKKTSLKPLYERPGRLSPGRGVPVPGKTPNEDLKINVHYDDEEEFQDPVKGVTPEFTVHSLNALDPFEDEALLSRSFSILGAKDKAKEMAKNAEQKAPLEVDDPSVFTRDGHKFMVNSDLMAGGAEPVHAKSAYDAGNPSFFTDAKKLTFSLIGLFALITAEFIGLVLLLK